MVRPVMAFPSREDTVRKIKSFVAAHKYGVPVSTIAEDFEELEGAPLDLPQDCESVFDLIRDIKQIKTRFYNGELRFILGNDPKVSHLTEMISKQKTAPRRSPPHTLDRNVKDYRHEGRQRGNECRRNNRQRWYNQNRDMYFSDDSDPRSSGTSSRNSKYSRSSKYSQGTRSTSTIKPIITPPPANRRVIQTPLVSSGQLIGDDFMLQLAIRELQEPIWREYRNGPLHAGLCVSGQTIRDCIKSLREVDVMSNKLVIMLGAEDIYQGRDSALIENDYEELLELLTTKFAYSVGAITICTIPPLGNISWLNQPTQYTALRAFNFWLVNHAVENGYQLADFYSHFSNVRGMPKYELFQDEPRRVSGTPYSYLLFCDQGRRLAMTLLRNAIDCSLHSYDDEHD